MKPKLLCLDNDEMILLLLEKHLTERLGYGVTREMTFEGVRKKLLESSYDLLTMSLSFPVHDRSKHKHGFAGLTFLQELRNGSCGKKVSEMPVLVLSGAEKLQEKVIDSISPMDNTWCMQKPFSIVALIGLLEEIMDSSRS